MRNATRNELQRALHDLNAGVRALLGLERTGAELVDELFVTASEWRRRDAPRPRVRRSSQPTLVRVK